jgi:DNA polymerase-3 subunit delta'
MIIGHTQQQKDLIRLAERGTLAHGYLFFGPEHVGKATFAHAFANYLETATFAPPGTRPLSDVFLPTMPPDSASIGIETVRAVKHFLYQTPAASPRRTVCIADAELLTTEAQNALLKIAEEPPSRGLLILASYDPERLLPTLRSRLQAVYFGATAPDTVAKLLQQEHDVSATEARLADARTFLRASGAELSAFLKDLVAADGFRFDRYLASLALAAAEEGSRNPKLWHAILALRRTADSFNLNPRLQLLALKEVAAR